MSETSKGEADNRGRLSFLQRLAICGGIILLGMIFAAPHPGAILFVPFYPIGLDKIMGTTGPSGSGVVGFFVFAIVITIVLSVSRRLPFIILCVILAIICGFTTSGCHRVLEGMSGLT
jgi:hypothetical protein